MKSQYCISSACCLTMYGLLSAIVIAEGQAPNCNAELSGKMRDATTLRTSKAIVTKSHVSAGPDISADGNYVAYGTFNAQLVVKALTRKGRSRTISLKGKGYPTAIRFIHNDKQVVIGTADGKIVVWNIEPGTLSVANRSHSEAVCQIAYSHQKGIVASCGDDNAIILWSSKTLLKLRTFSLHKSSVVGLAFSDSGKALASAGYDGRVILWDVMTGKGSVMYKSKGEFMTNVFFSNADKNVITVSANSTVNVMNVKTKAIVKTFKGAGENYSSACTACKKRIALGNSAGELSIWRIAAGKQIAKSQIHNNPTLLGVNRVLGIVFDRKGRFLVSRGDDNRVVFSRLD